MPEAENNSLRILFDLQACQTSGSAYRGVGRYSSALFETVASLAAPRDIFALTSEHLAHRYEPQNINPSRIIESGALPDWHSARSYEGGDQDALDGIALSSLIQTIKPDVIHVSHVFEGFGERVGLFEPLQRSMGQVISATLYDLIPLIFQAHYFQNPQFRRWYYARLAWLRKADLLLAISESSRQDAMRLLGIEPWRIVTVHGGISDHFRPPIDRTAVRNRLLSRFALREKIVLYTGGDDHRKNIKGAIRAFAKLSSELRTTAQLVIVCSMTPERKQVHLNEARAHGLNSNDILVTGYVSEQDLVDFYGICDVFVFPSLYEGLGLPVLEAMACGAPVIGGNNSSIRELIVREDALFDASRDNSITERITQVLRDKNFASDLSRYGQARAAEFNWKRTADLSLSAFDEAISRKRNTGVQCAISGWLPCKRLAVLSPLPPSRSGIADYNAQFLPFLARHFEIDLYVEGYIVSDETLTSSFRIFDVKDFEPVATAYDLILYEFGNSEFHAHMLPLLEQFPGAVGLHDAYLSGLIGYMDFYAGNKGYYEQEMLAAHGTSARQYFAPIQACPDPIGKSMVNLPCTKAVLDKAIGVISHSPFNLQVARLHYPQGWLAPYRTIPQMVILPEQTTVAERQGIRTELGFQPEDFVLVTFGHIAWTKWGDRLFEAFLSPDLQQHARIHLIFAGELADDEFGRCLSKNIEKAGLGKRIQLTGYLSSDDYIKYLCAADLAIQLRTKSRGGTPRGVLDCLAYGVPVIVNNDASYTDYPENIVIKLDPDPTVESIAAKVSFLMANPLQLLAYAERCREYVATNHNPVRCAAAYAAALLEFSAREKTSKTDAWVETFASLLGGTSNTLADAKEATKWLMARSIPTWQRRRLYIDVSHIAQADHETGIQRVVKEVVRAFYTGNFSEIDPVAVVLIEGELFEANNWLDSKGILAASERTPASSRIEFARGDILLMLDSSWERYSDFYPIFERARLASVPVITAIYDLLPITLPAGYFVDGGREWFEGWFRNAVQSSDGLLCISRATADEVIAYVENNCPEKKPLKVGYWHLGSNLDETDFKGNSSDRATAVLQKNYLLTVGTIEPRKSQALILDVMEILWAHGIELSLCVAGKAGWMVEGLMERMRTHPELGKRLFLIEKPSDNEIAELYQGACGLIFFSVGEGFGLPLVEAAHYGVPIICSDIPVFREIAGEFASYVKLGTPQSVSEQLMSWWHLKQVGTLPDTRNMPQLTWEESAEQMCQVIMDAKWLWKK